MTWFERIKTCETPEELSALLDCDNPNGTSKRLFCPDVQGKCHGTYDCNRCIIKWLREDAT